MRCMSGKEWVPSWPYQMEREVTRPCQKVIELPQAMVEGSKKTDCT